MILALSICLWVGWFIAKLAPLSPLGRVCLDLLVEKPAAWLGTLTLQKVVYLTASTALAAIFLAYLMPIMSGEVALLLAGDMLAYVELLAAVTIVALRSRRLWREVQIKGKAIVLHLLRASNMNPARRHSIATRRKSPQSTCSDDEGEPAFAMA